MGVMFGEAELVVTVTAATGRGSLHQGGPRVFEEDFKVLNMM